MKENGDKEVFVCNYHGHNIFLAERYGRLNVLTEGRINPFNTDRLGHEIATKMKDYDKEDYILLSGSPVIVCLVTMIAVEKADEVTLLIWNAKLGDYEVRKVFRENLRLCLEGGDKYEVNG